MHLTVKVEKKRTEALDICSYELVGRNGAALPPFTAGAHIDVHCPQGHIRQYSLCNNPIERHRYLISVLRDSNSRGGSISMHDLVKEGDFIQISAPKNHFPLDLGNERYLLLAGGIGITPILTMAEQLTNEGKTFELHYCTRSISRTAFRTRILESSFASRTRLYFDDSGQRINLSGLLAQQNSNTHLYVCGPTGFLASVLQTTKDLGWDQKRVHFEYFSNEQAKSQENGEFEVQIMSTGVRYKVPSHLNVVEALKPHGIEIPISCEQGVCGTCLTRVIHGIPDHRDAYMTDDEHQRNDQFTPCCSRAKTSTLVLDL